MLNCDEALLPQLQLPENNWKLPREKISEIIVMIIMIKVINSVILLNYYYFINKTVVII